jgi:hypothetical protein
MKIKFQYPVYIYTRYIQPLGICIVYTWYIPTIYLVWVPDEWQVTVFRVRVPRAGRGPQAAVFKLKL